MADEIQKLKTEGNSFFVQKKYFEACAKYSEGILLGADDNPILYANRAACRIAMSQYMDALEDARKATEIDPTYPKGWFRLASALEGIGQYAQSVTMYEKTIKVLSELPTPPIELKKECEVNLARARKGVVPWTGRPENGIEVKIDSGLLPWQAAEKILSKSSVVSRSTYIDIQHWTIAWRLCILYKDFMEASGKLKEMKRVGTSENSQTVKARLGVLQDMSNALLRDSRVFRVQESDFLMKLNDQVRSEANHFKAWSPETGPEILQGEVIKRLRKEGWDSVRPALTHIIRHWIIAGFVLSRVRNNFQLGVEFHRNALNMINWGRKVWKDVPKAERGVIFDLSFRRGVWNMYLDTLMGASAGVGMKNLEFLETIFEEADALLQDLEKNPYDPNDFDHPDPGFYLSFFENIKGNAFASKALYHNMLGNFGEDQKAETVRKHYTSAMELYIQAAACLPEDDENHPWYLNCAYNFMETANAPTSLVMDVLEKIRISVPTMQKIWCQNPSHSKKFREDVYVKLLKVEEHAKSLIAQKVIMLEGPFNWSKIKALPSV
ncbi:hypothetical protein F5876DRAFT_41234 [Lentinula aff. lateritia]|uniref:Uncharacterized protein n=1 Tax=Lentinula aff. lateritia TaxID=2804960 RepID=A0ACC1U1L9_9AGAR|nr:hypothetical protein F5876DRAFT_41234 [Lentinula aff. lateritia]